MSEKVHILIYHLDQGGVEKTAVNLANELIEKGNEVTITTIYKHYPEKFNLNPKIKLKKLFGFYIKGMDRIIKLIPPKMLYKFITRENFTIEVAFQADLPTMILGCEKKPTTRKYAWIHGIGFPITTYYNNYDNLFFVGEELMQSYKEEIKKLNKVECLVFYNAMDVCDIEARSKEVVQHYRDNFNIVSVGRLSVEKAFDRLVSAVIMLKEKLENVHLTIVGEGDERLRLEKIINDNNANSYISLIGFDSNPYKFIARADIYVCSSDYEGFNVAMSEAAILNIPIVSTDVSGARELLGNTNPYGIIVEKSPESILSGVNYIRSFSPNKDTNKVKFNLLQKIEDRNVMLEKYF